MLAMNGPRRVEILAISRTYDYGEAAWTERVILGLAGLHVLSQFGDRGNLAVLAIFRPQAFQRRRATRCRELLGMAVEQSARLAGIETCRKGIPPGAWAVRTAAQIASCPRILRAAAGGRGTGQLPLSRRELLERLQKNPRRGTA